MQDAEQNQKLIYSLDELSDILYLRSNLTGNIIAIPKTTAELFLSERVLALNPYWKANKLLSVDEVRTFVEYMIQKEVGNSYDMPDELVKKIARYVLIYAENIAFSVAVTYAEQSAMSHNVKDLVGYIQFIMPFLEQLREMFRMVKEKPDPEIVNEMILLCLNYGMDPL